MTSPAQTRPRITERDIEVIDGPSRDELFDALKLWYDKLPETYMLLEFTVGYRDQVNFGDSLYRLKAQIMGITPTGNGYMWQLRLAFLPEEDFEPSRYFDCVDLMYHAGSCEGTFLDITPHAERLTITREGRVLKGGKGVGVVIRPDGSVDVSPFAAIAPVD